MAFQRARLRVHTCMALVTLWGCAHTAAQTDPHPAHARWAYEGTEGPAKWANLSTDFEVCASGSRQSPIDIELGDINFSSDPSTAGLHYEMTRATAINNGHTVEDLFDAVSDFIAIDGAQLSLRQIHFHHPSEHTLNGRHFPLEIHFVHRDESGHLLVLALFAEEGTDNPSLAPVFAHLHPTGRQRPCP
jgi:carbonic anhydrase